MNGTISQQITAGETNQFPSGNFFMLLDTTSAVTVTFFASHGKPLEKFENIQAPFSVKLPERFIRVDIYSAATQTVKIVISDGEVDYKQISGTVNADITVPDTITTTADVTLAVSSATLIKAANTGRKSISLMNLSTTVTIRIGESSVAAAKGIPLAPLEKFSQAVSAAVYGYNPDGVSTVDIAIMETF